MTTSTYSPYFARVACFEVSGDPVPNTAAGTVYPANTLQLVARYMGSYYTSHISLAAPGDLAVLIGMWQRNCFNVSFGADRHVMNMQFCDGAAATPVPTFANLQLNPDLTGCIPI